MKIQSKYLSGVGILLPALAVAFACGDSVTNLSLETAPARLDIVSGNTQSAFPETELSEPLVVRVLDESGAPIPNQIVNFRVTEGGGSVFAGTALTDDAGTAQERWTVGPTPGTAQTVEARAVDSGSGIKQVFATFNATVLDPESVVASVAVTPASSNLTVGGTQQLSATARSSGGSTITGRTFTWTSNNTQVATVNGSGLVSGRAAGTATITASVDGRSASASITVASAASTDTTPPGVPGKPAFTTEATGSTSFSVTATWGAAAGADHYVWTTGSNNGSFEDEGEVSTATVTFAAPIVADAGGYWFCVGAVDAAGNSSEDTACNGFSAPDDTTPEPTPPTVESVVLSPSAATLEVGATRQMTASARDGDNAPISGVSFTWSSSNTSVATVSSAGLVTARAAGNATIRAATAGVTGTAAITVSPVDGGGGGSGSGDYTHEPAGAVMLSERGFDARSEDGWSDNGDATFSIQRDATAPKSPSNVGQALFRAGLAAGEGDIATTWVNASSRNWRTVYLSFWIKLSSNFVGHYTEVNKIGFATIHGNPSVIINAEGEHGNTLYPSIRLQNGASSRSGGLVLVPNVAAAPMARGQWHHWEVVLQSNSGDSYDGVVQIWLNGELAAQYRDVRFATGSQSRNWEEVYFKPIWGGMGGSVPENMYMWMDHFYVSGQ